MSINDLFKQVVILDERIQDGYYIKEMLIDGILTIIMKKLRELKCSQ